MGCGYSICFIFWQLLKDPNVHNNPRVKEYEQQVTQWRNILQSNDYGEDIEDVIELLQQIDPQVNVLHANYYSTQLLAPN